MSWWHWYLIAGLLVYGVALIWDRYVTVWRPPHVTLLGKLINAGVEILTLCVFTVAWPIVLVVQIRDMKTYTDNPPARFKKFKVSKRQLTKQLSVQEVERLEIVNDPIPREPVSHGHALGVLCAGSVWLYSRRTGRLCDRTVWLG
jgi:hypothetical protein